MSLTIAILTVLIAIFIFIISVESAAHKKLKRKIELRSPVLLLFAHADDDAMFFTPTIEYLRKNFIEYHMHLFSSNAARRYEFTQAAKYYKCENITISEEGKFIDGMKENWDIMSLAEEVKQIVFDNSIQTIITFDKDGVSGHLNHCRIHDALNLIHNMCPHVQILTLKSQNKVRKYLHFIDCLYYLFEKDDENTVTTVVDTASHALTAMNCYPSQLTWYRYTYLFFSTYCKINRLEEKIYQ